MYARLEAGDVDLVLLYELPKSAPVLLCHLSRARDVALAGGKQSLNVVALKTSDLFSFRLLQRLLRALAPRRRGNEIVRLQHRTVAKHHGPLDNVLQLTHVAGPMVDHQ